MFIFLVKFYTDQISGPQFIHPLVRILPMPAARLRDQSAAQCKHCLYAKCAGLPAHIVTFYNIWGRCGVS